jgi:hypothetical protein
MVGFLLASAWAVRANAQPAGWQDAEEDPAPDAAPVEPAPSLEAPPAPVAPPPPQYPPPWPPAPPPGAWPVIIQGDRLGMSFSISVDKKQPPFAYCPDACTLTLYPGEYWLSVHQSRGVVPGKRAFTVDGPSRAFVTPRTEEEKSSGRTMGYAGIGLIAGGMAMMLWGIGQSLDGGRDSSDAGFTVFLIGLGGVVTGSVLTPIGFVRGGRSAPLIEVNRLDHAPRR